MNFVQKKGVRGAISQKAGIGIMQDIPQFGAFGIPIYVELSKSLGFYLDSVQNCDCDVNFLVTMCPYKPCRSARYRVVT